MGFDTGNLFDAAIADAAGVQNGSMMLQLAIYNTLTGNYDVEATYAPSVTGGLVDENGQVLIAPSDFAKIITSKSMGCSWTRWAICILLSNQIKISKVIFSAVDSAGITK